jgi:hypothetical protein
MRQRDRNTTTRTDRADGIMTIEVAGNVALAPEDVLRAAVDFSDRRPALFPAVSTKHMTVHSADPTNADVTEGTRAGPFVFWERCTYDWSDVGCVTATVVSSNVYATPGSSWELHAEPDTDGSVVTMTWRRRFRRRPVGRFMGFVYRTQGKRLFTKYACEVLDNLDALDAKSAK